MTASDEAFDRAFEYALGAPDWTAGFRTYCEDFRVDEVLGFEPSGDGEHLLLHIEKTGENTRWVAKLLAEHYGIDDTRVGYCGLKDRRAVATQWFSVPWSPRSLPALAGCRVLASGRHGYKLRPGMHQENRFVIRLRDLSVPHAGIEQRLDAIAADGVPNYFGEQRFGIERGNLREVADIVSREKPRFRGRRGGLYLSAARSWLFNLVLSQRVGQGCWSQPMTGESGPEGPLWGRGRSPAPPAVRELEQQVLAPWRHWCDVLEHSGLRMERRPLVLHPSNLSWAWQGNDLTLAFSLAPGVFATSVLRELAVLQSAVTSG